VTDQGSPVKPQTETKGQQTDGPAAPADPRIQEKAIQLRLAQMDADLAEQRKKQLAAQLPATETKPLEGTFSIDEKISIESETLAYDALAAIARDIAAALLNLKPAPKRVVFVDADGRAAIAAWLRFKLQCDTLIGAYGAASPTPAQSMIAEAVGPALAANAVATSARAVLDLVALFRPNVDVRGKEFTLDATALVADVTASLLQKVEVRWAALSPLSDSAEQRMLAALAQVRTARNDTVRAVGTIPDPTERERVSKLVADVATAQATFEQALLWADSAGSSLTTVVRGEAIASALRPDDVAVEVRVLHAGGTNRVTRRLWSAKLDHSGGAIATFAAYKLDGSLLAARTFSRYRGYVTFDGGRTNWDKLLGRLTAEG
jgi:hypothetical protein